MIRYRWLLFVLCALVMAWCGRDGVRRSELQHRRSWCGWPAAARIALPRDRRSPNARTDDVAGKIASDGDAGDRRM
jgi:hypothetical protein